MLLRDPLRYQYSLPLSLNPGWLDFDTQTYTLSGTAPTIHDDSSIPITLIGRDSHSGLTSNVTLHLALNLRKKGSYSSAPIKWPILVSILFASALVVGLLVAAVVRRLQVVKRSVTDVVNDMHLVSSPVLACHQSLGFMTEFDAHNGKGAMIDGPLEEVGPDLVESRTERLARSVSSSGDVRLVTSQSHSRTSIYGFFNGSSLRSLGPQAMRFMPSMNLNFLGLLHGYAGPSRRLERTPTPAQSIGPSVQPSFSQLSARHPTPSVRDSTSSWDRESSWLENKRRASRNAFWRRGDFAPGPLDDF